MSAALYDHAYDAFLSGQINWVGDTIRVALLSSAYTADMANDQYFSAASSAMIGTAIALSNKSISAGVANADPVTSPSLPSGSTVTQIVLFKDTGDPATSLLIAREDVTSTLTNGGVMTLSWDTGANKIFKL